MNRRWMLGLALAAVAGATGCATLARQAFTNPVVEVKDVVVKGLGTEGGSLDVILNVQNPNEYRIDATRISYQVWVDSNSIATGEISKLVTLENRGTSEVVVPVQFTYASVQRAILHVVQRGSVDYKVTGAFTMATPFGNITRPYSGTGRFDSMAALTGRR